MEGYMETEIMNHLRSFKELLSKEADYVSELVKLEERKYESLKLVDMEGLMRINSEEEETLQFLDSIEKKRKKIIVTLSGDFHFDPNISLAELFTHLPDEKFYETKQELIVLRTRIKNLTEKLQMNMKENSELIKSNLEIINMTLNFANRNSQKETYNYRTKKESKENIYIINQIA
jgi:hypothetical protein